MRCATIYKHIINMSKYFDIPHNKTTNKQTFFIQFYHNKNYNHIKYYCGCHRVDNNFTK